MSPRIPIRLLAGQSDERLLALVRDGHERAFEALVHRYRRPLLRYVRRTLGVGDFRAEDVVQQALLRAWLALARGTEVRNLKPWLYRIAHNTALNAIRGAGERHLELVDGALGGAPAADESPLERGIDAREALSGVAALPAMQREAILLTAIDGQSHEEAARALGISNAAIRGLIYRARTALRSAAAAITPQPLLAWALGASTSATPTAERVAEIAAGGGAFGATGVLLKGAVVALSAAALATGASVVRDSSHVARRPQANVLSAPARPSTARGGVSDPAGSANQVPLGRVVDEGSAERRRLGAAGGGSAPPLVRAQKGRRVSGSPLREDSSRSDGARHGAQAPATRLEVEREGSEPGKDGAVGGSVPSSRAPLTGESPVSRGPSADGGSSGSGSSSGDGVSGPSVVETSDPSNDGARMSSAEPTSDDLMTSGH